MLKNFFILVICLGLFPLATQGAIYKWVDEDGKVHYSQQKPQNIKTEKIKVNTRTPENSSTYSKPSLNKKDTDTQASDKPANTSNQKADKKPEKSAKERADLCKKSRANLQTLASRGRIRQKDDQGNLSYMSEEQKQQRIKREQDRVKEYCN